MTRALEPAEAQRALQSRVQNMAPDRRQAFETELEPIAAAIAKNPKDQAARVARAALLEKYDLTADALEEYRKISEEWPDVVWVGSRIFVHEKEQARQAPPAARLREGKTYALLVGISKYQRLPEQQWLRYAHNDALVFQDFLKSSRGGSVPDSNILLLTDEKATTAALRNAFETFLKARAGKNDTVVVLIAAHGIAETTGRRAAYIVTHDSDPEDLASTALPMADIQSLIREDLGHVGHQLVFVDVCRAGNIGALRGPNPVNKVVEQIAETEGDLFLFLASGPKEFSYEGPQYGGGHGAFSYFLLDAVNGGSDVNRDGIVNIGEIIEHVREQVIAATAGRQHPRDLGSMEHGVVVAELKSPGIVISKAQQSGTALLASATGTRGPAGSGGTAGRDETALSRDVDEAIAAGRILPDSPSSAFLALNRIHRYANPEEYLAQQNKLRIALEDRGQQVLLRYLSGDQAAQSRDDFRRGAAFYEAARLLTPESLFLQGRSAFCEGRALLFDKDYRRAVDLLEHAVRIDPDGAYSYNALGIAYLEQADYTNAIRAFRDAIRRASYWAYPLHNIALAYTQIGDYASAINAYRKAIELAPRYSYLPYNLGLLYQRMNRRKEAEAAFRTALALAPNAGEPYNGLGFLYASAGRRDEAHRLYLKALEKNPDLLAARHNLALLLSERAETSAEAHALWRENLAKSPAYLPSRLSLARSLAKQGSIAEAAAEFKSVLEHKPEYAAARIALSDLHLRRNDADAAVAELRVAAKARPSDPAIEERIGDAQQVAGRQAEARSAYSEALQHAPDKRTRRRIEGKLRALR